MSDNIILYSVVTIVLILILFSYKYNKVFAYISLLLFAICNLYLFYGLSYWDQNGGSLIWFFYLITFNSLQAIVTGIYILVKVLSKFKHK